MPDLTFPSPENALVVIASHYPVTEKDVVDWNSRLFDDEGFEHRLVHIGGIQAVTKLSFSYAIWDRRTGKGMSHHEVGCRIGNAPMSDIERTKRHAEALRLMREWRESSYKPSTEVPK